MKAKLSSLKCVKRRYEFNDGSIVLWTPADDTQKAHGSFRVDIVIKKDNGLVRSTLAIRQGPPSESASLHWLKWAIRDMEKEAP
jgi:hypothetical protein